MAGPATDVEDRCGGRRQVFQQMLVHHECPDVTLHGGVGLVGETIRQLSPDVVAHRVKAMPVVARRPAICQILGWG